MVDAVEINTVNIKARFRKATAQEKFGDRDGAQKEVKTALRIDPEDTELAKLKGHLDMLQAARMVMDKKMCGRMFTERKTLGSMISGKELLWESVK